MRNPQRGTRNVSEREIRNLEGSRRILSAPAGTAAWRWSSEAPIAEGAAAWRWTRRAPSRLRVGSHLPYLRRLEHSIPGLKLVNIGLNSLLRGLPSLRPARYSMNATRTMPTSVSAEGLLIEVRSMICQTRGEHELNLSCEKKKPHLGLVCIILRSSNRVYRSQLRHG
jgi:hypothetical protein